MEKNNKIRVFMIGYSQNKGGVEAYISNLVSCMDKSRFEIIYKLPEMIIDGKKWVAPLNRHNYIKYRLFWKKFFRENKFDVLYLNTCDVVSIDDLRFAKSAGIPTRIIHSHSTGTQQGIQGNMSLFHRFLETKSRKKLDKYATHLFACSKSAGDWMFDGRKFRIINNGVKLSDYIFSEHKRKELRKENGYETEKIIGVIGRLSPVKNLEFAFDIIEKVTALVPEYKGVIIGDGEQKEYLKSLLVSRELDKKIKLIGSVDNVNEWLSAVDCILMPSLFEGLPFVLVEAQAAGLHCVVSSAVSEEANITGLVDFVSLDEDKDVWARKVMDACAQPRSDVSQKLVETGYSIEDTAKTVSEIIENALKN